MYQLLTSRNVWIPELVHYKIMMFRVFLSCTHCLRGQTWRYVGNVISRSHFIVLLIVKMIWVASHSVPRRQKGPVEHKHNKKCCDIKTPKSGGKNHISQISCGISVLMIHTLACEVFTAPWVIWLDASYRSRGLFTSFETGELAMRTYLNEFHRLRNHAKLWNSLHLRYKYITVHIRCLCKMSKLATGPK